MNLRATCRERFAPSRVVKGEGPDKSSSKEPKAPGIGMGSLRALQLSAWTSGDRGHFPVPPPWILGNIKAHLDNDRAVGVCFGEMNTKQLEHWNITAFLLYQEDECLRWTIN